MYETALHGIEFALFTRQVWSNTQWFLEYGSALAFPRLVKYGVFHKQVIHKKNSF